MSAARVIALTSVCTAGFCGKFAAVPARVEADVDRRRQLYHDSHGRRSGGALVGYVLSWQCSHLRGNWPSSWALFVYAASFSFAYVSVPASVGALLLFGAVQATMVVMRFGRESGSTSDKRLVW